MTTFTPSRASARAQPLPSPLLDAQTMALRPSILKSMDCFRLVVGEKICYRMAKVRERTSPSRLGSAVQDEPPSVVR